MAVSNDTQVAEPGTVATPVTITTYKDALCFALEVNAILRAAAEEINSNHMEGVQGIMKRISENVHVAMSADEVARGQICNELLVVQTLINRINDEGDSSLLYAAESLIDMTVARLSTPVEVAHG